MDPAERLLLRDSLPIPVTPKVFETLLALVENNGHMLEKEELIRRVWPDAVVEEANLAVNISVLRKTLGDDRGQKYIETVPKHGYRFVAPVRRLTRESAAIVVEEHTRSHLVIEQEIETGFRLQSRFTSRGVIGRLLQSLSTARVVALLLLVGSCVGIYYLSTRGNSKEKTLSWRPKSIAVLRHEADG